MSSRFPEPALVERPSWVLRLESERENLRSALTWALNAKEVETSLLLAGEYGTLCFFRGPLREGQSLVDAALSTGGRSEARAQALWAACILAYRRSDLAMSRRFAGEVLSIARDIGDVRLSGRALRALGIAAGEAKQHDEAEPLLRGALAVFREIGDESEVDECLNMLGWNAMMRADYAAARPLIEEALLHSREASDTRGIMRCAGNLGYIAREERRFGDALVLLRESVTSALSMRDVRGVADQLIEIVAVAAELRRLEPAIVMLGGAEALYEETEATAADLEQLEGPSTILRNEIDADRLARLRARGREMTLSEIVEHTVEFIDSTV